MTDPSKPPIDLIPNLILLTVSGSRLYGTETETSDWDWRGVFQTPTRDLLRLNPPNETFNQKEPADVTAHEVGKFIRLCMKVNPNLLEILWAEDFPVLTEAGGLLVINRHLFLSAKYIRSAYKGFIYNQIAGAEKTDSASSTRKKQLKFIRHMIRVADQGIEALETGEINVRVKDKDKLFELSERPWDQLKAIMRYKLDVLETTTTDLPELPDKEAIDELLLSIRDLA